jgi:patatin-like phospholipase/acyl hydrolase
MRILSIDGGGIRGIIPGTILVALEQKLQRLSGDPAARLADYFDMIAGTSTGGILTCLYLCPNAFGKPMYSAQDAVNLYMTHGAAIFDVGLFARLESLGGIAEEKYSAAPLESLLLQYLGGTKLSQLLKPCLITSYDIERREAVFFNSQDIPAGEEDFLARDVARATSAAPTFFPPAHITSSTSDTYALVDGGVFCNNPSLAACVEAFGYNDNLNIRDMTVLSLGTGSSDKSYPYDEARNWGGIKWLSPMLDIMMAGVSESTDYQLAAMFKSAKCSSQYLRIQCDLSKFLGVDSAMDNASLGNLKGLQDAGQVLAKDNDAKLEAFADMLLKP